VLQVLESLGDTRTVEGEEGMVDDDLITTRYGLVEDLLTDYGLKAKAIVRYMTRAGRHLQKQAGAQFWYEKDTQEAVKLLFVRASDIRKENGIIPPD
jgi:hypothetical protein